MKKPSGHELLTQFRPKRDWDRGADVIEIEGGDNMGIFDPDDVITIYSLEQAIEDGVLV